MAIGADYSLPKSGASPLRAPPPSKQSSVPAYGYMPPMINDAKVSSQANNLLAGAAGAGRATMQSSDRAGVSRGRGQAFRSEMGQADADAKSQAGAAGVEMGAASANASARNAYENTMRGEQVSNQGLLNNLRNQSAMERLAKRGFGQDQREAVRRGQFGLDSIYLDSSPLLQSLFQ